MKKLKVVELFAGVGGFKIGLEGYEGKSATSGFKTDINSIFEVIWSNQWEPSKSINKQIAFQIYKEKWPNHTIINEDITKISTNEIPDHDVLVGGFPCQDYSVARVLSHSKGLEGTKGQLWHQIIRILQEKKKKPAYLILENVDRLISSPSNLKGRDFAIMIQKLNEIGYDVEWKIINAAELGFPQKRKRIFILGYLNKSKVNDFNQLETQRKNGAINNSIEFEILEKSMNNFKLEFEESDIIKKLSLTSKKSIFGDYGFASNFHVFTCKTKSILKKSPTTLGEIIENQKVSEEFYLNQEQEKKFISLKEAKDELRKRKGGGNFRYKEGSMSFPDDLNKPSRTIITSEGGKTPSRTKHVIKDKWGFRRLTPLELERLNMFPDNYTAGYSNTERAFLMGNALVTGVVELISYKLK